MDRNVEKYDIPALITEYCKIKGIDKKAFADKAEFQRTSIYQWGRGVKVRQSTFDKILSKIPDFLNPIIVDKIDTLSTKNYTQQKNSLLVQDENGVYLNRIPIYETRAFAGYGENTQLTEQPIGYIDTLLTNVTCSLQVSGDSMADHYHSGDYLLLKEKNDMSYMVYDRAYVIVTKEEVLFKYVCKSDEEGEYILKSENTEYSDIVMPKKSVIRLFHIEKFIGSRRN